LMSEGTYTLCPRCRRPVEPDHPGVHYGRTMRRVDAFGPSEYVEDKAAFFHEGCTLPRGWVPRPMPERP
jgi:hypothetical protein